MSKAAKEADDQAQVADPAGANDDGDDGDEGTGQTLSPEAQAAELKRARNEAARYRKQAAELKKAQEEREESERQAKLTAEERVKEQQAALTAQQQALEAKERQLNRKTALIGHVTHPDHVLRLADDDKYWDGDTPDLDTLLADFPMYKPTTGDAAAQGADKRQATPGARRAAQGAATPDQAAAHALRTGDPLSYAMQVAEDQMKRHTKE